MATETVVRPAENVDECGWLIKGHGLSDEQIHAALVHEQEWWGGGVGEGVLRDPFDWYEAREVWVRKFNQPKDADYAWMMQITEPHARGAGRFTFIDSDRQRESTKGEEV